MGRHQRGRKNNKKNQEDVATITENVEQSTTESNDGILKSTATSAQLVQLPIASEPLVLRPQESQRPMSQPPLSQQQMQEKQVTVSIRGVGRGRGRGIPQQKLQKPIQVGEFMPQSTSQHIGETLQQHVNQPVRQLIEQPVQPSMNQFLQQVGQPLLQHTNQHRHQNIVPSVQQHINLPVQQHVGQPLQQRMNQSAQQHIRQPVQQHINPAGQQNIGQPLQQPVHQHIRQSVQQRLNQFVPLHVGQPVPHHVNQPVHQYIEQPVQQQLNQLMRQHEGQPQQQHVSQLMVQSMPQVIGQSTPQHIQQHIPVWPQQSITSQTSEFISPPKTLAIQLPPQVTEIPTSVLSQQGPSEKTSQKKISDDPQQQLTERVKVLTLQKAYPKIPKKIVGKQKAIQGRPIQVLVNYLELKIACEKMYCYNITISPEKPKFLPKILAAFRDDFFPKNILAFDQKKNFISSKALKDINKGDEFVKKVSILDSTSKEMNFEVSVNLTGVVSLRTLFDYMQNGTSINPPQEAIQCLNIILRPQNSTFIRAGRSYFTKPHDNIVSLGEGMEMWPGIFQSAIFASRPFINIDVTHKAFPKAQKVLEMFKEFGVNIKLPIINKGVYEKIDKFLKGLKVQVCIAGMQNNIREMRCCGLDSPANEIIFICDNDKGHKQQTSVKDYFATKGNRLQYPHLNCLWFGTKDKKIYYPPEFCYIPSEQVLNRKLKEQQKSIMVKKSVTSPDVRIKKIYNSIKDMDYNNNPTLKDFGLTVGNELVKVPDARVLDAPNLKYSNAVRVPRDGKWWSGKLVNSIKLDRWVVIAVEMDQCITDVKHMVTMLLQKSEVLGMKIQNPLHISDNVKLHQLEKKMSECRDEKIQLLMVIIPPHIRNCYEKVKKMAEKQVGILTQCIKDKTIKYMSQQTAENLLLKINTKLGGINQVLHADTIAAFLKNRRCMIVGADVIHPSPEQKNVPSIAAVTASIDEKYFTYNVTLSIQYPQEMITDMKSMMCEHLQSYYKKMKAYPAKIIYFRDGVSEGEFSKVLNIELPAMQDACSSVKLDYKPEIVIVIVQKRHHTRFFKLDRNETHNVPPGTIVDTTITHPTELDYYLVSHKAIQGTARPTRYHCIANQGDVPSDELQQLTYYLCHLYSRCSRTVSYPAPTYYAHLACTRGRALTFDDIFNLADLKISPQRLYVKDDVHADSGLFFV